MLSAQTRLRSYGLTHTGLRRAHNEDAFACDDALGLWVVADGVGGHAKGEVASQEAVEQIFGFVRSDQNSLQALARSPKAKGLRAEVRRLLESAVQSACYMVFGMGELDPEHRGMSTTISALAIVHGWGVLAQVGDSRIYRVRDAKCTQLTEDHTLVNYELKHGLITPLQAQHAKDKNVITRAVGHRDYVEVDTHEIDVRRGDRYLLCSDGLHGYLERGEIERVLAADNDLSRAPQRFIELANARGGRDNITVVLVDVSV
jgi:protein phosphatase